MIKLTLILEIDIESENRLVLPFLHRNYSRQIFPASITEGGIMGTWWETWHWWFFLPSHLVLLPQTLSLPHLVHTGEMSPIFACGRWHMLINLQRCVLWAHPGGCWVQPPAQTTREVLGDEAGPQLTQEVSLQAWVMGISGQEQAWLSWRAGLSPAWLGQRLRDQSLDPWAGMEEIPCETD